MNEDELLDGVARGDPDWSAIYRACAKDVYAAALQILGSGKRVVDSKDVEDIVQQTFVEGMRGGVLTPDTRSIAAALRTVARRRALDAVRRGSKVHDSAIDDLPPEKLVTDDAIEDLVEHDFDLEIQRAVWRNQKRLTSQERRIFRARAIDDRTFSEIAKDLNLTPQWVGQIYRDAKHKLLRGLDLTGYGGDV